jgi:hypothetical protein
MVKAGPDGMPLALAVLEDARELDGLGTLDGRAQLLPALELVTLRKHLPGST